MLRTSHAKYILTVENTEMFRIRSLLDPDPSAGRLLQHLVEEEFAPAALQQTRLQTSR